MAEKGLPFFRAGKLLRFRKTEIDSWLERGQPKKTTQK
jgi:excisionase family DNA binding protein